MAPYIMIFNRLHYYYAPSNPIWNDLIFSNVLKSKRLTKLRLLFIERVRGKGCKTFFIVYCPVTVFCWAVKLYLAASIMTLRPMTVRERTDERYKAIINTYRFSNLLSDSRILSIHRFYCFSNTFLCWYKYFLRWE